MQNEKKKWVGIAITKSILISFISFQIIASSNGYYGLSTYICICLLMSCPDHISCTHSKVFSEYFKELEEESIRDNFVIIYELMDELMDFGYPQTTDSKILQEYDEKDIHTFNIPLHGSIMFSSIVVLYLVELSEQNF